MSVRTAVAMIAVGLVAACGSQVEPEAFYAAQLGTTAAGGSSAAAPSGAASSSAPGAALSAATSGAATSATGSAHHTQGSGAFGSTHSATATGSGPHASPARSSSHAAASSTPAPAACTPPTTSSPTVLVCPSTGLHDGQTVHVYASGFQNAKPTALTKALVVTQCADKGNDTQQADCGALHFVNPDANGRVDLTITVVKIVGSNKNVCGGKYKCLISVAQPKQPPDYEADQHISFA